ncbi:MAG: aldose 1-epimerase [Bacteroidia bacterium]
MSFQINKKPFGKHALFQLIDNDSQSSVWIIPSCGAMLNNFQIKKDNVFIDLINGYKSGDDLDENVSMNFKGVILSPFANRVNKASYDFNNSNYVLDKVWKDKDYAIHGYLYNQVFEVVSEVINDDEATLILKNKYDGKMPGFPFSFDTTVVYTLHKNNQLSCETKIQNSSEQIMPLSFGWHPLFFNDVNIDDVELQFPAEYKIGVTEDFIPDGKKIAYNAFNSLRKIDDTFFDYCFKLREGEGESESAMVAIIEPLNKIKIELHIETGLNKFRHLQIYIPPQRNTIALEPMTSWPDAFNNKNDLIVLQPEETVAMSYEIKISLL